MPVDIDRQKLSRSALRGRLKEFFPTLDFDEVTSNPDAVLVPASHYLEVLKVLKSDPVFDFDYLEFQTCADFPPDRLEFLVYLYSYRHTHRIAVKVLLDRLCPSLPSLAEFWANADWNEREVFDLFGVVFHQHPDLRRLMMPEDWEGHPLRKDYLHPNVVKRPD